MTAQKAMGYLQQGSGRHGSDRPIDLVHLAKQTLGDRSLENEVLQLFMTQSDIYMKRLESANDDRQRFEAAHTIKGSARNIGAWGVADAAAHLEQAQEAEIQADVATLRLALMETRSFIRSLLDES
ncbi:MAG: Hpt domain-containing protein [Rhizobiales bacterium]|nr:Hpt domain-containing protein [Hyphomicrobiales bacterium]